MVVVVGPQRMRQVGVETAELEAEFGTRGLEYQEQFPEHPYLWASQHH